MEKAAARPPRSPTQVQHAEQAGRSPTGLAAAAAAIAVTGSPRNFSRNGPSNASPPSGIMTSQNSGSIPDLAMTTQSQLSSSSPPKKSYMPTVSSPLNPQPLSSGMDDGQSRLEDAGIGGLDRSKRPSLVQHSEPSASRSRSPPIQPMPRRAPSRTLHIPVNAQGGIQRDRSPGRIGTPVSMRELGADYTRYFNPFSDSRRSSFIAETPKSGAQTPVLRLGSSGHLPAMNPSETVSEKSARSSMDGTDTPVAERRGLLTSTSALTIPAYFDDRLGSSPYLVDKNNPYTFPMYTDEKEDDDEMHMPAADDDIRYKASMRDHFNRTNICSTVGLVAMILGLLFIFIIFPVLTYTGGISFLWAYETPLDQMPGYGKPEKWAIVNDNKYPFLQHLRRSLIDPDTPKDAMTKKSFDGSTLQLAYSDEFNDNNRTFYEGDDPYWFAADFWYGATQDLDWYDPDAVTTWEGALELRLDAFHNHGLNFRSGMLNSWNQLCFKGGAFEVSVSLPGPAGTMGLWPGAWTMGNLGRPGYLSTTDGMWPYTYNECDAGITPNQSSPDGISRLPGQRLPACTCEGEDHPTPGTGRGAPEIDIFEASASYQVPDLGVITQSFQVAPFDPWYYVDYDYMSFPTQNTSYTNTYTGGPYQQAVSGTSTLNNAWYDGKEYQKYSFDYRPGTGEGSWITWNVGDDVMFTMDGRAIRANGNIGARQVSEEPMSMILNLGFSNSWVAIDWAALSFPTIMRVDYVRIYQPEGEKMITCDPPGYETTDYIANHMDAYTNPNWTHWDQTPYSWPKHQLNTDNCAAT